MASKQPTKALARKYLETIEARIADGKVGIEQPTEVPLCGALLETFADGLQNRNAKDDQSRMRRALLADLGDKRLHDIDVPPSCGGSTLAADARTRSSSNRIRPAESTWRVGEMMRQGAHALERAPGQRLS